MKTEKSCGAVVYKEKNGKMLFLAEHMVQGHVSIPKGHMEKNETEAETALREIREETGLEVALDTHFRHVITYSPAEGVRKDVVFFAARAGKGKTKNQESEVSSLEWLPYKEAVEAMTYEDDKETLREARKYLKVVDKAMKFAVKKHAGGIRKGSNTPYIMHPAEAGAIAAGLTEDREVIAAAILHDTLEDTDTSREELISAFGTRIANMVAEESEDKRADRPAESTWEERKRETIDRLRTAGHEAKLLTLADKLSNIRAMERDSEREGAAFWNRFNQKDPARHAWYYRTLLEIFLGDEALKGTQACREYEYRVNRVFGSTEEPG